MSQRRGAAPTRPPSAFPCRARSFPGECGTGPWSARPRGLPARTARKSTVRVVGGHPEAVESAHLNEQGGHQRVAGPAPVAHHEAPARAQDPHAFAERRSFYLPVEVMEEERRDDQVERLVVERHRVRERLDELDLRSRGGGLSTRQAKDLRVCIQALSPPRPGRPPPASAPGSPSRLRGRGRPRPALPSPLQQPPLERLLACREAHERIEQWGERREPRRRDVTLLLGRSHRPEVTGRSSAQIAEWS